MSAATISPGPFTANKRCLLSVAACNMTDCDASAATDVVPVHIAGLRYVQSTAGAS